MYTDLISYQLASGVTEEQLTGAAESILESWMSKQEGFIAWHINKTEDGYTDIVVWDSKESADKATANMKDLPADNPWYACYDFASISSQHLQEVFSYHKK